MKQCPKCENMHDKPGTFCTRACANSRVQTAETKKKISNANKGVYLRKPMTTEEIQARTVKVIAGRLAKYNNTLFEDLSRVGKKRRILEEQEDKCNHCGISEWQNAPLVLELEHKDGNNKNDTRNNLECICPNCHSQTTTWRGRNNKTKQCLGG